MLELVRCEFNQLIKIGGEIEKEKEISNVEI